jgi:hypothetical protein
MISLLPGEILLVANLFHPIGILAFEIFLNGNVGHDHGWRGTMPMFLTRRDPYNIARTNFLDRATPALDPAAAGRHDQGLARG